MLREGGSGGARGAETSGTSGVVFQVSRWASMCFMFLHTLREIESVKRGLMFYWKCIFLFSTVFPGYFLVFIWWRIGWNRQLNSIDGGAAPSFSFLFFFSVPTLFETTILFHYITSSLERHNNWYSWCAPYGSETASRGARARSNRFRLLAKDRGRAAGIWRGKKKSDGMNEIFFSLVWEESAGGRGAEQSDGVR